MSKKESFVQTNVSVEQILLLMYMFDDTHKCLTKCFLYSILKTSLG